MQIDESSVFEMVVGRATLLKNAFRRMDKSAFNPKRKLRVSFKRILVANLQVCFVLGGVWRRTGC